MSSLTVQPYQPISESYIPDATPPITHQRITGLMARVLEKKTQNMQKALNNKWDRYNPIFIGGDLFTMGYLAFEGVRAFVPSTQGIAAITTATLVCGVIAGGINVLVAAVSLKEAIQAFRNGDQVLGLRLLLDFFCLSGIGVVMILASLASQFAALGGIGAFFAANPWLLPVLFFVITIPLLVELSYRIKNIYCSKDLTAQLKLDQLRPLLENEQINWEQVEALYRGGEHPYDFASLLRGNLSDAQILEELSKKMELLQADLGVVNALEIFKLMQNLLAKNQASAIEQLTTIKKGVAEWNHSLYVRMFQQILYVLGFVVSMVTLSPRVNANLLNGVQNLFLAGANAIPLYMDTFWPFKRNTPIVVPKVSI